MSRRLRAPWVVVSVALFAAIATTSTSAVASAPTPASRQLAAEVCEDMVRDSAVAAAGEELVAPQQGSWSGRTYTCTYDFADGRLAVRVDMRRSTADARTKFAALRRSAASAKTLYGIGQQGFIRRDGVLVTRKDEFILTVDSRALPDGMPSAAVTWSTTRAIFDCW